MSHEELQRSNPPTPIAGHEPDEVNVRGVIATGLGLALMVLVVLALMGGLTVWFAGQSDSEKGKPEAPSATHGSVEYAPLDVNQPQQLRELRAAERERLSSYGWIDPTQQVARIPIERAMELIAEKGFDQIPIVHPPASEQEQKPSEQVEAPQPPAEDGEPANPAPESDESS